ncbi:MAG: hypothetical protein IRZ16_20925, partial [Myxococcaceae bacterium]|nr:hypothetical protein [Myxococcaceae bacterium]
PETRDQASVLGVHAFVTKPFGILEIVELCDRALARFAERSVGESR